MKYITTGSILGNLSLLMLAPSVSARTLQGPTAPALSQVSYAPPHAPETPAGQISDRYKEIEFLYWQARATEYFNIANDLLRAANQRGKEIRQIIERNKLTLIEQLRRVGMSLEQLEQQYRSTLKEFRRLIEEKREQKDKKTKKIKKVLTFGLG